MYVNMKVAPLHNVCSASLCREQRTCCGNGVLQGTKRRKVSPPKTGGGVREEGEVVEVEEGELVMGGGEVKKMKFDEKVSGFTPFNYQGASFTDYTSEWRRD